MVKDEKLAENQRVRVQSARERVERGLARANEYETAIEDLRLKIERAAAVDTLVQQFSSFRNCRRFCVCATAGPDRGHEPTNLDSPAVSKRSLRRSV